MINCSPLLAMPSEMILAISRCLDDKSKYLLTFVCSRFTLILRDKIRTLNIPPETKPSHLEGLAKRVGLITKITAQNLSCGAATRFLKNFPALEILSLPGLTGSEEERDLAQTLATLRSLRVLEITSSSVTGKCIPPELGSKSLILVDCKKITHLDVPEAVSHLDVSDSVGLTTIAGLAHVSLLRSEGVELSLKGYQGKVYIANSLLFNPESEKLSLLESGANINAANQNGATILHSAISQKESKSAAFLIHQGANPNAQTHQGFSALSFAIHMRDFETAFLLLEKGAVPNSQKKEGEYLLIGALERENYKTAELLLKRGIDPNTALDRYGNPALFLALPNKDMARLVLSYGANPNIQYLKEGRSNYLRCTVGNTPLHFAVENEGKEDLAAVLLEYGADVNAENVDGETPLYWAVRSGTELSMAILLNHGADPNKASREGTPINRAILTNNDQKAALLLEWGANPFLLDHGKNSFEFAEKWHCFRCLDLFYNFHKKREE